ncbi:hypothetical protein SNEBB_004056 [Seison nebaliae]|nr:hypothetical protein SNEBB_004056 [Seison nebaliae]
MQTTDVQYLFVTVSLAIVMVRPVKRQTAQSRAGLCFPVRKFHNKLKQHPNVTGRVNMGAAVYLTAVTEYLLAELCELSGNCARDNKKKRITPRHQQIAIMCDSELKKFLRDVTIPEGGVIPSIVAAILPSKVVTKVATIPTPPPTKKIVTKTWQLIKKKPLTNAKKAIPLPDVDAVLPAAPTDDIPKVLTLSEKVLLNGQKLTVLQGDIVDVKADAIIHPTGGSYGFGGIVGTRLSAVGGADLTKNVTAMKKKKPSINLCEVAISLGSGFSAPYVIHVHSPTWSSSKEPLKQLETAVFNVLQCGEEENMESIALPSIGSGNAGYPKQEAARTILQSIANWFKERKDTKLQNVNFVLFDMESIGVYTTELARLDVDAF